MYFCDAKGFTMRDFSRISVCLLALSGLIGARAAYADTAQPDFKMHVLDPTNPTPPPGGPDYITGLTFSIAFAPCAPNELPNGITAQGCYLGFNRSNVDWTGLQFTFQNNSTLNSQTPDCSLLGKDDIFQVTRCSLGNQYVLNFLSGVIPNSGSASAFFITEDGVDPALFGTGQGTVTSYTAGTSTTPEPAPFVLLGTGLLLLGWVGTHRSA